MVLHFNINKILSSPPRTCQRVIIFSMSINSWNQINRNYYKTINKNCIIESMDRSVEETKYLKMNAEINLTEIGCKLAIKFPT